MSSLKTKPNQTIQLTNSHNSHTTLSDWQSDGCKLIESNKTHSVCACTHLTTFGLLSKWDSEQPLEPGQRQFQPQFQQHPVLQLDNIENELFVPLQPIYGEGMSLYLGKVSEQPEEKLFSASSDRIWTLDFALSTLVVVMNQVVILVPS